MDQDHYHLNPKRRSMGQDWISSQVLRYVGFVPFIAYLGMYYESWLPPWAEGVIVKLTALALAVGLYWLVGWWYERFGTILHAAPSTARELAGWTAAIAMMCTALVGSDSLVLAIVSLLAEMFGLIVMTRIVLGEMLGKRRPAHWLALWLLILCASIIESGLSAEQSVAFGFLGMSIGLAIGIILDHRRFVKSLSLRVEKA